MTLVGYLVDAGGYLTSGHVFVANMTGNVVFLGLVVAGAHGSIAASLGRCQRCVIQRKWAQ
jgi:uncharacterized membrane protein YoaK (UPF0700 family)